MLLFPSLPLLGGMDRSPNVEPTWTILATALDHDTSRSGLVH